MLLKQYTAITVYLFIYIFYITSSKHCMINMNKFFNLNSIFDAFN